MIYLFFALQESKLLKFLGFMWNPLSWVMEAAALMAIGLAHGGVNQSQSIYAFAVSFDDWYSKLNQEIFDLSK